MKQEFCAENSGEKLYLELDEKGFVQKLSAGEIHFDCFVSDFEIQDDLDHRIYRGRNASTRPLADGSWERTWQDAPFAAVEYFESRGVKVVRKLVLKPVEGMAERSVSVRFLVSYPDEVYTLKCWSAHERFPADLPELGGLKLYYEDICYGTVIPAVAVYDNKKDCGITFGTPFSQDRAGRLSFAFRDYHSEGVDVEFSCLWFSGEHPVTCELHYAAIRGCWRSALNFWVQENPEYFEAPCPETPRMPKPFFITNPQMEEAALDEVAARYQPAWAELHNHFSRYGEYAPEAESWQSIIVNDYPDAECTLPFTVKKVNDHIEELHKRNIQAMMYLQASGDCTIPYAEAFFPDSIARDSAGNIVKTWINCCFVNAMPGTAFHDHLMKQIDRFFKVYPEMDGVFLDQLCYHMIDYAHFDGKTAVNCRRASRYGDSYYVPLKRIAETLHNAGKALWANGPFSVEVAKDVDGMMSEGTGMGARTYQYMTCGSKGLLIHSYATSSADVESMFRQCIICGGTWSVSGDVAKKRPPEYPAQAEELFALCGRLVDLLAGCRWVLDPEPFTLPEEYEGNLYKLPDGSLSLGIASLHDTLLRRSRGADEPFKVEIRCTGVESVMTAEIHSVDGDVAIPVSVQEGVLSFEVPNHRVFSVIVLK